MTYKHFGDYVASLSAYDKRLALTTRRFIKLERLNYEDLRKGAYKVAHYLTSLGVKPGDRVMVVALNCPEWLELFFGVQLIGATLVPVDASSSLPTVLNFIGETEPTIIFRSNYLYPELHKRAPTYILEELNELIAGYPETVPSSQLNGEMASLIVFTSGTTAAPKGVVLTHKNVLSNILGIQKKIDIGSDWRLLSVLPLSHMYELTGSLSVLSRGASIFYMPRVTPLAITRSLQDYHINTILAIPQLLSLMLENIQRTAANEGKARTLNIASKLTAPLPLPLRHLLFRSVHSRLGGKLNLVVTGGAPIPVEVATAWERMGVKMVQGYGLTETSPILTVNGLNERRLDSPGQALSNVRLRIAEDGEIQAKGASIFSGYWRNPEATKAAFTADGWFKSGDIGSIKDGWLHIQGRLKFAIVLSSGLKVFPEDIELVADKNPDFKSICIVGVKRPEGESVFAVVISEKSDQEVTKAISDINAKVESFQHIDEWLRWPDSDFPRTRLLKIDRKQVQLWANTSGDEHQIAQKGVSVKADAVTDIIRLSLGNPKAHINETDRLADVGLDSLRRLNVVALIEEQLGITIPEESVTGTTIVSDLRKLISSGNLVERQQHFSTWQFNKWVRLAGNGVRESVIRFIIRIWVKLKIEGRNELNGLKTPAIFIFNHADDFDGPVIFKSLPHYIRKRLAAAAAEDAMLEHKVLSLIVRFGFAGFYFSRHEPYMPSLEYVGKMIDQGWSVVLAPEGRLSTNGKLQPFKSGIGLLAVNLGVPIIPMKTFGLSGTVPLHAKWPKKHSRVTVRIGQPVSFPPDTSYDQATAKLQKIMEDL